jgi:hypothetical protein
MPGDDLAEPMSVQVGDGELLCQLRRGKTIAQVGLELAHAVFAVAVMAIEVVCDIAIDATLDSPLRPRLEDGLPVRVV